MSETRQLMSKKEELMSGNFQLTSEARRLMSGEVEPMSRTLPLTSEARRLMGDGVEPMSGTFQLASEARRLMSEEVELMSGTFPLTSEARRLMGDEVELMSGTFTLTSESRRLMCSLPLLDRKHGAPSGTIVSNPINHQPLRSQQTNLNVRPVDIIHPNRVLINELFIFKTLNNVLQSKSKFRKDECGDARPGGRERAP